MKNKIRFVFIISFLHLAASGQIYIRNVSVVDVLNQKLIPRQTVVLTGDMISGISSANKIKIPVNANVIEGAGKYLIPGLTDAHVHFFQSGGLYTRPDVIDLRKYFPYEKEISWVHNNMEYFLRRYLQTGITSVIDVGASYHFLQQRDSFANKYYAPTIYMTGPLLTTWEPAVFNNLKNDEPFKLITSDSEAVRLVQEQLPFHPDFIKIWYIVNSNNAEASAKKLEPVIKTIIEESHRHHLKVAIHATERITAQIAVENGCDYLVHDVEDEVVTDRFIKLLKTKKVFVCPTLTVMEGYDNSLGQKNNFSYYELTRSNPEQLGSLNDLKHLSDTATINQFKQWINSHLEMVHSAHTDSVRKVNLKKMMDGGVTIVAGTDAGNIGTQHAVSFLKELKAMQKSGLTNWQIIQSATINPAGIFNNQNNTGSISMGKKADMVLLDANPVENLENLTKINLVFNKGHIINPDTLIRETPLALVQRQLNAFNARNPDAFLEPYADSVEIYDFPGKLLGKGKRAMTKMYADFFKTTPELHCEIIGRILQGNMVIDKERVSGVGDLKNEATAIYYIENNKISKVYFAE